MLLDEFELGEVCHMWQIPLEGNAFNINTARVLHET
jgi:hypothetical protein